MSPNDDRDRLLRSAMQWHEGWLPLVLTLDAALRAIDPDYTVGDIKEKFGRLLITASTLRTGGERETFQALIREAEGRASHICEWCGGTNGVTTNYPRTEASGWVRTLCAECRSAARHPMEPAAQVRRGVVEAR